ncbi:class I SAM-dependent DNA methyltransferase [Gillisia sp. JM1]|uniref:class I SAM-dependent DNA methyltransferase n=1 Tax=Gillisia sp. JM1 TaxID=1283286 RepID=UPI00041B2EF7|nr:TaqI-like C-terminal specificity domain-containing protein [Gillisia sp. JM1]
MQTEQSINSGNTNILKPRKALNKAFLKVKPNRSQIEQFKENLIQLLDRTNDTESEEFHKNLVIDFLKKTYYEPNHFINTKGRNDLVIHNGNKAGSTVGVIIEAKKPTNRAEMLSKEKVNVKAFQELVLYYLRERITQKNLEVKYLIATNINEWYIFDANIFEKSFAQNKRLVSQFIDFEAGRLAGKTTDFFYKEIAEPFIAEMQQEVEFTHFDIRNYERPLRNNNPKDDNKLIALFKLLSPEHLLKLPFTNDSNSLDKRFYGELLHIIGLTETKQGGKKLIERQKQGNRNTGSFLENAIIQLESMDKIGQLPNPSHFGDTQQERLFNVGLELSITWLNRILFLKLLEAQLLTYQKGDTTYEFLSLDRIQNYDDLNSLFFQVLAQKHSERNEDVKALFEKVPYLNSSLFEPTDIEHATLFISNLRDDKVLPIYSATVLKDKKGKKRSGELNALEYLFEFLNSYDFSSEGGESIQEDNKTLINASVLGLIFEKINGYKDGSFFTPGFITMYMCRETIRKAVVQKFNETKSWECKDLEELYDRIEDRKEANTIINSLKICDPAVGSGHFLVSALNEIIAIKNDLNILQDRSGRRLKEYQVEVVNDELIVTDEEGELFEYNPSAKESQRIQEALFHEKQQIIENCLFGVDINPNSVKICRLRLWIELLKNTYYKWENDTSPFGGGREGELETLPNIDINIKCGNSLISRFDLDADLSKALKESKWNIDSYRLAVDTYRNAENKEQKREMEKIIHDIKNDFRSEISSNDPKVKRLQKVKGELFLLTNQTQMFEMSKREKATWNKKLEKLSKDSKKLETEIQEIKDNKIYENAFEWRFEFPEVLNEEGDYVGFDVVIGNPPYIQQRKSQGATVLFRELYSVYSGTADLSVFFFERAFRLLKDKGQFAFISTNKFFNTEYGKPLRRFLMSFDVDEMINFELVPIFDEALVSSVIIRIDKKVPSKTFRYLEFKQESIDQEKFNLRYEEKRLVLDAKLLSNNFWLFSKLDEQNLVRKLNQRGNPLSADNTLQIRRGITTGYDNAFIISEDSSIYNSGIAKQFLRGKDINRYKLSNNNLKLLFVPWHFPIHNDNSIQGASQVAENEFKSSHAEEYNHLVSFKHKLENRNKSETGIRYEWYALQRCAASYFELFEKEKIVWGLISGGWDFAFDQDQKLLTSASFLLTSDTIPLKYILALFNSKLYQFYFSIIGEKTAGGAYVFKKTTIEKFLIPKKQNHILDIIQFVEIILQMKKENPAADTSSLEAEIDQLVYKLYGLTEEEIDIVESA